MTVRLYRPRYRTASADRAILPRPEGPGLPRHPIKPFARFQLLLRYEQRLDIVTHWRDGC